MLLISDYEFNEEKTSKKRWECFVGIEKSSTFASAFRKEQHFREEFFERFRYKQASSTKAYLGKKTETVNNLNKLKIDLVLEQIKTSSSEGT